MSVKTLSEWMETREARSVTCFSKKTLDRLARDGRIGVMKIPGIRKTVYSRADVEALVASGVRPATVNPAKRAMATA